ncbi:hypothetical protein [Streptomyces sp. G-G2]|uniref:hypothetical protein n=1 Tax=Streptomyces sp. G-G2 TaxID=3046201 RepID=UPI0024BB9C49|nr:hypothetical protein [Streptomyces sp. G-G2]MDJ0381285.1 hypothetical protein [Streptomyces sp. G-G2]
MNAPRPAGAPRSTPPKVAPADRGATQIADRVVAKIAAQAAREALAGLPAAPPAEAAPPHATVTVHHDVARVRISLELGYPADLAAQCAAVRHQVAHRVEDCAGMAVPEVDIDVERLHPVRSGPARRERLR